MNQKAKSPILSLDPNVDTCDLYTLYLQPFGYEVVAAQTVLDGWRLMMDKRFDLCIIASRFPDGDGLNVCNRLRESDPQIPIIFNPSDVRPIIFQTAYNIGVREVLPQLTKPDKLLQAVQTLTHQGIEVVSNSANVQTRSVSPASMAGG